MRRPVAEIRATAERLRPRIAETLTGLASVEIVECESEIGSGALPTHRISSAGLSIRPSSGSGADLIRIAAALRRLPVPLLGRIQEKALILDLRCLEDETTLVAQLASFSV
jgi:L-seryl-tRNA(Ser) seleniumtransferase